MGGFQGGREKHFVHRQHAANFLSAPKSNDKSSANGSEIFFSLYKHFLFQEIIIVFFEMSIVSSRSKMSKANIQPTQVWATGREKNPTLVFWWNTLKMPWYRIANSTCTQSDSDFKHFICKNWWSEIFNSDHSGWASWWPDQWLWPLFIEP